MSVAAHIAVMSWPMDKRIVSSPGRVDVERELDAPSGIQLYTIVLPRVLAFGAPIAPRTQDRPTPREVEEEPTSPSPETSITLQEEDVPPPPNRALRPDRSDPRFGVADGATGRDSRISTSSELSCAIELGNSVHPTRLPGGPWSECPRGRWVMQTDVSGAYHRARCISVPWRYPRASEEASTPWIVALACGRTDEPSTTPGSENTSTSRDRADASRSRTLGESELVRFAPDEMPRDETLSIADDPDPVRADVEESALTSCDSDQRHAAGAGTRGTASSG